VLGPIFLCRERVKIFSIFFSCRRQSAWYTRRRRWGIGVSRGFELEESVMVTFASRVTSLERERYITAAIGNWKLEIGMFDFLASRAIVISHVNRQFLPRQTTQHFLYYEYMCS